MGFSKKYSRKYKTYLVISIVLGIVAVALVTLMLTKPHLKSHFVQQLRKKFVFTSNNIYDWGNSQGKHQVPETLRLTFLHHQPAEKGTRTERGQPIHHFS